MPKEYQKRTFVTDWSKVPIVFDVAFAANLLALSYEQTRALCAKGVIPACKVSGRSWRINKKDFMKFIGATE